MQSTGAHPSRLLVLALLSLLAITAQAQPRIAQLTATEYFTPDVNTVSLTPLPRVPPSPYGTPARICPLANGLPYAVDGYPGTPYVITPFSEMYRQAPQAQPSASACRPGLAPQHCMLAFDFEAKVIQARPWDAAIPGCAAQPPTELMSYNGSVPGPTIWTPV